MLDGWREPFVLFRYEGLNRVPVDEVRCGDIAVVAGIEDMKIGDTLCPPDAQDPLPAIHMDEPTISMEFYVSNSPFAGQEGQYVTSRQILTRLERAALRDVALVLMPPTASEAGDGYELRVIAAVVIGGGSLNGGQGTVLGTVVGSFIMGLLSNGCNLLGVSPFVQQVIIGSVIVLAVTFDEFQRRRMAA